MSFPIRNTGKSRFSLIFPLKALSDNLEVWKGKKKTVSVDNSSEIGVVKFPEILKCVSVDIVRILNMPTNKLLQISLPPSWCELYFRK